MKIAIPSKGNTLDAPFDNRFGRAENFIIYDLESNEFKVISNEQNLTAMQGAGIQTAQNVLREKVDVVLTANCGPKAFQVLNQAGVKIYNVEADTVKEALDKFKQDQAKELDQANVEGHWA